MANKLSKKMIVRRNELAQQVNEKMLTKDEAVQSLAGWLLKRDDWKPGVLTHNQTPQENALLNAEAAFEGIIN